MFIDDAIQDFRIALIANGRSTATLRSYTYMNRDSPIGLIKFLRRHDVHELECVETRHIRHYVVALRQHVQARNGKPLSEDTLADFISAAHRFFRWCAAEYKIVNPMEAIEFPRRRPPHKPRAISLSDVRKLLDVCADFPDRDEVIRNRAIILMLIDTGCRAGGLCGLTSADIDFVSNTLVVKEKGSKLRNLQFSSQTARALKAWENRRARVVPFFYTFRGLSAFTPDVLRHTLERIAKDANVKGRVNPHSFRHAFAINYLRNGGDIASLSKLLGHANIETTIRHYIHFTNNDLSKRHEMFSPVKDVI